jgi:toxin ParE1/3/4
MRLRWIPAAADDLEAIGDYLAQYLPSFRQSTIREIYQSILALRSIPYRGRAGREEGTRELVLPRFPYIVVYRVQDIRLFSSSWEWWRDWETLRIPEATTLGFSLKKSGCRCGFALRERGEILSDGMRSRHISKMAPQLWRDHCYMARSSCNWRDAML